MYSSEEKNHREYEKGREYFFHSGVVVDLTITGDFHSALASSKIASSVGFGATKASRTLSYLYPFPAGFFRIEPSILVCTQFFGLPTAPESMNARSATMTLTTIPLLLISAK